MSSEKQPLRYPQEHPVIVDRLTIIIVPNILFWGLVGYGFDDMYKGNYLFGAGFGFVIGVMTAALLKGKHIDSHGVAVKIRQFAWQLVCTGVAIMAGAASTAVAARLFERSWLFACLFFGFALAVAGMWSLSIDLSNDNNS